MRLDKLLSHMGYGSRKDVKALIRKGFVMVNGEAVYNDDEKIDEKVDEVFLLDEQIFYKKKVYFLLNKPKGYVSATYDSYDPTVLDLIKETQKGLFPVGRLDKDTTGLLLITNDGDLAHRLLAPKHHVEKTYELTFSGDFHASYLHQFETGIQLLDGYVCKPARFELIEPHFGRITIIEGKFHQIKRMMEALGLEVTSLKRISFGGICLPKDLLEGKYRELTQEELSCLNRQR
ncbi:MAG: rRNA pseudouridine synthase [Anaeroplasmataceae bacterium]|nr:rRNA pseudouridine synthase [Anaeroplasmataceae bacterium]